MLVDGTTLPDEVGAAFWRRFSAYLDAHRGDLAGFAAEEGFASVHPELRDGCPTLVASHSTPQRPYAPASEEAAEKPPRSGGKRAKGRRGGR